MDELKKKKKYTCMRNMEEQNHWHYVPPETISMIFISKSKSLKRTKPLAVKQDYQRVVSIILTICSPVDDCGNFHLEGYLKAISLPYLSNLSLHHIQ
jgi:hypothetical protein